MQSGIWVVARTKAQREKWAAENVTRQGGEPYLPKTLTTKVVKGRRTDCEEWLFPNYMFVRTDGQWRYLRSTFGIISVVMRGETPAFMPEYEITKLRQRESEDGLIRLAEPTEAKFKDGDLVRINSGSFSGYKGVYSHDANHRVSVLLDFLGRKTPVFIPETDLELAG